jgi:tetratricopeptide (TPR) repeat protein
VARGHVAGALLRGDPSARAAWGERVTALVERTGDVRRACQERGRVGYYFMDLGAYERAVALLREVLAQARALGLTDVEARAQHNLGLALARVGEVDEGRAHERAAADAFHARGNRRMEGASYEYLALIAMSGGAWADAEAAAREALRLGTDPEPLPLNQAESLAILARALLAQGRAAEALDAAREGLRILESLDGTDEGESLIRLAYAEALAATGDHAAARDAIGSAERRLLARADRITDGAARASFLERVPENARTLELVREARQKP